MLAANKAGWLSMGRGAILPIATLLLVMLMVVPVPATMLDIGFISNIMISLAVLMVAPNVAKPLDFSSFPAVLLFTIPTRLHEHNSSFSDIELRAMAAHANTQG